MDRRALEGYLYLLFEIFFKEKEPSLLTKKRKVSSFYSKYFTSPTESPDFSKTINRNLKFAEAIRNGTIKKAYNPSEKTLKILVAYNEKDSATSLEFEDFLSKYDKNIRDYINKNPINEKVLKFIFPEFNEKLAGIENRILKIEKFIESKDGIIENLFQENANLGSLSEVYGTQKMALDFIKFLQLELIETRKQYIRAKIIYKRLGSFGLFFIPLKYAIFDEQSFLIEFLKVEFDLTDDDLLDDVT